MKSDFFPAGFAGSTGTTLKTLVFTTSDKSLYFLTSPVLQHETSASILGLWGPELKVKKKSKKNISCEKRRYL